MIENPFEFGRAVEDEYFTDRINDAKHLEANLTHGINTIIISPRRWGKTSLVKKVISQSKRKDIKFIFIDVFSCKSDYEFCKMLATETIRQTSSRWDEWVQMAKTFLSNITPKFSFGTDPMNDFSLSFAWNPKDNPEREILQLPEKIAEKKGIKIVVCFDEFQQIADFKDSLTFQKKLRTVWQHQKLTTYCMFGSKKHLMENIFQNRRMPFYMFGEMLHLDCIPTEYWVPFICSRFEKYGKKISEEYATRICKTVKNYSSYVQQLAWNVMAETEKEVNEETLQSGISALLQQCHGLFVQQTEGLTTYQLNFLRLLCSGIHSGFTAQAVAETYPLGSKSNIDRIKKALIDKELITLEKDGVFIADCVFELWFKKEMM